MKILDRYILVTYLKTFFSVFIILMFIFVLQTIWLYISELAGKDLDVWIVLKFLWYVSPRLIPLVLPLTILVTSLMVFGSFSEKYEFAAMKSTGISLQRAMRSLTVFILVLAAVAFFFANDVIPYSEYKWQNLRRNIAQVSPSMVISEGQFSQIGDDFNIKVSKKSGDRDQFLNDIVIHKKNSMRPNGNYTVIIADNGELASEEGSNTLSLILNDGYYYDDVQVKDPKKQMRKPFAKSYFETYTINIDLTKFNDTDIDKENEVNNHNMYKISELFVEIDSLSNSYTKDIAVFSENMHIRTGATKFGISQPVKPDTIRPFTTIVDFYNEKQQSEILDLALTNVRGTLQTVKAKKTEFQIKTKRLNKHEIALHEKYVLALACIILFFVGAPLGAIIRKGGMGLPMVVAILLFLTYHFIGIFAKNSAEDGTMHPFIASWLSTVIMLPLSIWLTYRATTDQGIFDIDTFLQRITGLFKKKE
ncbi:lipopolysaccharide export system permease protein [Ulvibacter sp. MAR_2010_11]|uniref:LptF/LptG family permease n=1 Tax=Ulvibacter sp. MAR_2010_11 TaxID=1250229 RepID=UPI000C2CD52B|nr:LptF/LptG family permease [Ulvibacter sp. MAR_2010_11]PKA84464.1 lipopolysaccharide export system permease protein [Ulvibacter sp. MAR_2010_11]